MDAPISFLKHLDQLRSSYLVISSLMLLVGVVCFLFWIGLIRWFAIAFAAVVRSSIWHGFQLWLKLFAWARWQAFLVVVVTTLFIGWATSRDLPNLTVIFALIPLFMGAITCLAYMYIDLERYAVSRGHNGAVDSGLIDALRTIENQKETDSKESPLDIIPMIVISAVDPVVGQLVENAGSDSSQVIVLHDPSTLTIS